MNTFEKFLVALIIIVFAIPFYGGLVSAAFNLIWGVCSLIIVLAILMIAWAWVGRPAWLTWKYIKEGDFNLEGSHFDSFMKWMDNKVKKSPQKKEDVIYM